MDTQSQTHTSIHTYTTHRPTLADTDMHVHGYNKPTYLRSPCPKPSQGDTQGNRSEHHHISGLRQSRLRSPEEPWVSLRSSRRRGHLRPGIR